MMKYNITGMKYNIFWMKCIITGTKHNVTGMKHHVSNLTMKLLMGILLFNTLSCKKYLELRPDQKQVVLHNLTDCQALLDNYSIMNALYPSDGEVAADNYFMLTESWQALKAQQNKDTYIWKSDGEHLTAQWLYPYQVIYSSNLILQKLEELSGQKDQIEKWKTIKGAALFFRAYALYQVAQLFAAPYQANTAGQLPGMPVRLSPDMAIKSDRGTLKQTYQQIITDLLEAKELLPVANGLPTRPVKAAAYAALARVYLSMQNYEEAGIAADQCLTLHPALMDYNTMSINKVNPFPQFNKEVIFHSLAAPNDVVYPGTARIDPELMKSYDPDDLRIKAFFTKQADETFIYKGDYNGKSKSKDFFNGLATDEIYLIRAECYARSGNKKMALQDLNALLKNRIATDTYTPFDAQTADQVLSKILEERRKELLFRNLRWTDLRRLNQDSRFAISLKRKLILNGVEETYTLNPKDQRYIFLIPMDVISNSGLTQNERR